MQKILPLQSCGRFINMLKNNLLSPLNFNRTQSELEEFLLLCIFVAGKSSKTQSAKLAGLLESLDWPEFPVSYFASMSIEEIGQKLRSAKVGQYNRLEKCLYELSRANFNLKTCSCEDLESIHGIGMKTSRFFLVYSRENANHAILDVHILRWLGESLPDAPKSTPTNKKQYLHYESVFLNKCKESNMKPYELDFAQWVSRQKSW